MRGLYSILFAVAIWYEKTAYICTYIKVYVCAYINIHYIYAVALKGGWYCK